METPRSEIERLFRLQREGAAGTGRSGPEQRLDRLHRLKEWILDQREAIRSALYEDFRKPHTETDITEVFIPVHELRFIMRHLRRWMAPRCVRRTLPLLTTRSRVRCEPLGTNLIMAPFNYPFLLVVQPLSYALAAGNRVILKPSELTPKTARLVKKMTEELFDEREVATVCGGVETATVLLEQPFDHIYFTGSGRVGRIVLEAAARHLTPVTLELGGKSPALLLEDADPEDAAARIAWGKFGNTGHTCIAPDYVLVHDRIREPFLRALTSTLEEMYGSDPAAVKATADYGRVIDEAHMDRFIAWLEEARSRGAKVVAGGSIDPDHRYLAPTVLTDVPDDAGLMQEEIFGPILPVRGFRQLDEALDLVGDRGEPLALYCFGGRREQVDRVIRRTRTGAVLVNDVMIHYLHPRLPFGGVGSSGYGNTSGWYGFRTFSQERAVMEQGRWSPFQLVMPPYTRGVRRIVDLLTRWV